MDMWDTPVLETERLLLRPFTEDDLPAVFAIFSDREVNRFLPWFPVRTMEEAESFFQERYAAAYRDRSAWKFAICLKRDDIPIGYVTLSGDDSHDLGYGLRREYWGMGIATEAGQAVIRPSGQEPTNPISPCIGFTEDVCSRMPMSSAMRWNRHSDRWRFHLSEKKVSSMTIPISSIMPSFISEVMRMSCSMP